MVGSFMDRNAARPRLGGLVVGFLAVGLLAGALAGTGVASAGDASRDATADACQTVREQALAAAGSLDETGTRTVYTPDGTTTETITGHTFVRTTCEHLRPDARITAEAPPALSPIPAVPASSDASEAVGVGSAYLAEHVGWNVCDTVSHLIYYTGEPGSALVEATDAPTPALHQTCGVTNSHWLDVTIDNSAPGVDGIVGHCAFALAWDPPTTPHAPQGDANGGSYCTTHGFGGEATYTTTASHGAGILISLTFASLNVETFYGHTGVVTVGE